MRLLLRPSAREDILKQYDYYLVEKEVEEIADRFLVNVQASMEQVCRNPGIGSPKSLANPTLRGLRSWPIKGFPDIRIYYLHTVEEVRVVRVLHGRRDIYPMLEEEIG